MTLEDAVRKINKIENVSADAELAHSLEDGLYLEFIVQVAQQGDDNLKAIAKEILKSQDIHFSRWRA